MLDMQQYVNNVMSVPNHIFGQALHVFRTAGMLPLLLLLTTTGLCARGPQPVTRILLESLGFKPISSRYLLAGSSMLTVHYVDQTHLLLTYNAHRLIRRVPNDPPTDVDRNVDALLLEVPSGNVLARAEWQLHDHGQYLWNLGQGHFLLRTRDTLTTIAPMLNLAHGEAFRQQPFLNPHRHVVAVLLSSDTRFLTVESTEPLPLPLSDDPKVSPGGEPQRLPAQTNVQLNFYRLGPPTNGSERLVPRFAGRANSHRPVELPLNGAGFLNVIDQGHQKWAFDFRSHDGKTLPLALYDSTCRPLTSFISPGEFIALGCHGGTVRQQLAAFNLRGDAMWIQTLGGSYLAPHLDFAPVTGRFALERINLLGAAILTDELVPAQLTGQSVDVIQNDSGKTLLHLETTPIVRAGQNFTFSPDGMSFAIMREGAIEIYALPALTSKDKTAIQMAQAAAPRANEVEVRLTEATESAPSNEGNSATAQSGVANSPAALDEAPAAPSLSVSLPTAQPSPATHSEDVPDVPASSPDATKPTAPPTTIAEPPKPRKPPTLYNPDAPSPSQPPQ
jgi:hypothetical protein